MTNKKGFTLIELLAVIVILAIIALITAPIVVGVITNSRESSNKVSGTNYIRAVNTAITTAAIDNTLVEDGYYEITKDGNICLDELQDGKCVGNKLKIKVNGNKPIKGNMLIENEEVSRATVVFKEFTVEIDYDGNIEYKPFSRKYEIGQVVKVILGHETSGTNVDWYVIDEDAETVTLLFSDVVGQSAWNNTTYHGVAITTGEGCIVGNCAYAGPLAAYVSLNTLFSSFDIPYINYEYKNNISTQNRVSYQGFNVKNGEAAIISHKGENVSSPLKIKARLISAEEVLKIASLYDSNINEEKLMEYLSNNIDTINKMFSINISTIDELFEQNTINDDLVSLYATANMILSYQYGNNIVPEEIKFIDLPNWLIIENKPYWTNTTYDFKFGTQSVSYPIQIFGGKIENQIVDIMYLTHYYIYDNDAYLRPVIQMKKNDKRVH